MYEVPGFLQPIFHAQVSEARQHLLAQYDDYWKSTPSKKVPCYDCGRPARVERDATGDDAKYVWCRACSADDFESQAARDLEEQMSVC